MYNYSFDLSDEQNNVTFSISSDRRLSEAFVKNMNKILTPRAQKKEKPQPTKIPISIVQRDINDYLKTKYNAKSVKLFKTHIEVEHN